MRIESLCIVGAVLAGSLIAHAANAQPSPEGISLYKGQPPTRIYEIHGAEVYDVESGVTWQRCSVGQTWAATKGCIGPVRLFSFDDAQRLGGGVWRLPTNIELAKLIDHARAFQELRPTLHVEAFPDTDPEKLWYWTSTSDGPYVAWYASFVDGRFSLDGRNFQYAVRLVRDGR